MSRGTAREAEKMMNTMQSTQATQASRSAPPRAARPAAPIAVLIAAILLTVGVLLLLLAATPALAQTPVPAPAGLNPQAERISDQAIRADLTFIGTQLERARRLNDSSIQPFSNYHFAKGVHWIEFAYDEYQIKNRSGVIEQALAEGTRLIAAMENRAPLPDDTPLIGGAARVREDLWNVVAKFKADKEGFRCAGGDVGRLEVQLVWAGYIQKEMGWRSAKPYLQAAERYYRDALAAAETCPRVVAKADESIAKLPPARQVEVLADRVHFAYDRANISPQTAPVLDRIASILRANAAISISIEGHADERGGDDYNRRLSQRRADAVRAYLAAAGVETSRMKTSAFGKSRPEVKGADAETYAVNRRVVIVPSVATDLQVQPQREDLQLEKRRAR